MSCIVCGTGAKYTAPPGVATILEGGGRTGAAPSEGVGETGRRAGAGEVGTATGIGGEGLLMRIGAAGARANGTDETLEGSMGLYCIAAALRFV